MGSQRQPLPQVIMKYLQEMKMQTPSEGEFSSNICKSYMMTEPHSLTTDPLPSTVFRQQHWPLLQHEYGEQKAHLKAQK